MSQQFDAALQELAIDVDALDKRVQDLKLRVGELRALRRQERARRDPELVERTAAFDMLQEVKPNGKARRIENRVLGVWHPEGQAS